MNDKSFLKIGFFVLAAIYLIADLEASKPAVYFIKPALVGTLLIYFWGTVSKSLHVDRFARFIVTGLLCSLVGDSFLMFEGDMFFSLGQAAFLAAHLFYGLAFLQYAPMSLSHFFKKRKLITIALAIPLVFLMRYLWLDLGSFQWLGVGYAIASLFLGVTAFSLYGRVANKTFLLIIIGVTLMIGADAMVTLGRFKNYVLQIPNPHIWIMSLYLLGQFFITEGSVIAHDVKEGSAEADKQLV